MKNKKVNTIMDCKRTVTIVILLLTAFNLACAQKNKTLYSVIESTYTVMANRKFDIEHYEKNKNWSTLEYTKEDGTKIKQIKSGADIYLEYEMPPNKLYIIYREYYLSGNLKKEGMQLGNMPIGIWHEFEENGEETSSRNMEEGLPDFDYNRVMLLMQKEGRVDTRTGGGRGDFVMDYKKDIKRWVVYFLPSDVNGYRGTWYEIDGKSGKIKLNKEVLQK